MIETARGVVLRTYPLRETSTIVHWLTADFGRIATAARGARGPKSAFRGKLDLFYTADFSFNRSRRSELHTLREVTLRETHSPLRLDLGRLRQVSYCTALVALATETETPLPGVYGLVCGLLDVVSHQPPLAQTVLAFELKLLQELGLQPDLEHSRLSAAAKAVVGEWAESEWPALPPLPPGPGPLLELRRFLHGFLAHHLGRIPRGREPALDGR